MVSIIKDIYMVLTSLSYIAVCYSADFAKQTINMNGTIRKFLLTEVAQPWGPRNVVVSPMAALLPLGQLYFGADESTKKEIEIAFGTTKILEFLHKVIDKLDSTENRVQIGMSLVTVLPWIYEVTQSYKEAMKSVYNLQLHYADFSDLTKVAKFANLLMNDITEGVVTSVVKPEDLSPHSSLVLLGATYFKGEWDTSFKVSKDKDFFNAYDRKVLTKYMTSTMKAYYHKSNALKAEIIQFPFKGGNVVFTIFLPFENNGVPEVLKKMKMEREILNKELKKMTLKTAKIMMPRFRIETQMNMIDVYRKIGVERIFEKGNSGLGNLLLATNPWVSYIKQNIKFVSNDKAATAIDKENEDFQYLRAEEKPEIEFKAAHPFLFLVLYKNDQLFAGVINKPNKIQDFGMVRQRPTRFKKLENTNVSTSKSTTADGEATKKPTVFKANLKKPDTGSKVNENRFSFSIHFDRDEKLPLRAHELRTTIKSRHRKVVTKKVRKVKTTTTERSLGIKLIFYKT